MNRAGLFTAGTRVRWEDLPSWLAGLEVLRGRICRAQQGAIPACRRHLLALAGELEHIAVASRVDLDRLLKLVAEGRTWRGLHGTHDAELATAGEAIAAAAVLRDRHLRRLDGEPEEGERRWWHIVLLHRDGLVELDGGRTVLKETAGRVVLHRWRERTGAKLWAPALLLIGDYSYREVGPTIYATAGAELVLTREVLHLEVPWFQTWRPEVRAACLPLIERLRGQALQEAV